jgi:O-antigen/teichoic acid export membrane protein
VLLRSTLIYAPAVLFIRVSSLILLVIATRLMDQTEYGLLALVVTIGELADGAAANWLRIALLRLGGKGEITRGTVGKAARVLAINSALGLLAAIAIAYAVVPDRALEFAAAVALYLVVGNGLRFGLTLLQMQQRHGRYSSIELMRSVMALGLPVLAMMTVAPTFFVASIAGSIGAAIAGGVALRQAWRKTVVGPARFETRDLLALGLPLMILALVGFGINSAERLVLTVVYDASAVAVYAAAYALARQPIDVIANAINMGAFPELVSRFDEKGPAAAEAFMGEQLLLMLRLTLPIAALLIALAPEITEIVLPADYHADVTLLFPVIVLAVIFANLESFVFGNIFHVHKRIWRLIVTNVPGAIAGIGLAVVLVPPLGALGAALALLGGTVAGLAASIALSLALSRVPIQWRHVGLSVVIAVATGLTGWLVALGLSEAWPFFRLAAGGAAGGTVFLVLLALIYPQDTARYREKLMARLWPSRAAMPKTH